MIKKFFSRFRKLIVKYQKFDESISDNPVIKIISKRYSCRHFSSKKVPEEFINAIIDSGRYAPSTVNLQTWSFVLFNSDEWFEKFNIKLPFKAPYAILILGDYYRIKKVFEHLEIPPLVGFTTSIINASIAATQMMLTAEALGLATIMLSETHKTGFYYSQEIKEKLQLPPFVFPFMTIAFGYPKIPFLGRPPRIPRELVFARAKYPDFDINELKEWYDTFKLGYKIANPSSSFEKKLSFYSKEFDRVEKELNSLIFPSRNLS